jgi:hypothetical protein
MQVNHNDIKAFWEWFELVTNLESIDKFILELDKRINDFGSLSWEIGDTETGKYLAISPNLNLDNVDYVIEIISMAPSISNWIFFSFKQPKPDWKGIVVLSNFGNGSIEIDISNWRFIIFEYPNKIFDIDVYLELRNIYFDVNQATEIALLNTIGEEKMLKYFVQYSIKNFDEIPSGKGLDFNQLGFYFQEI